MSKLVDDAIISAYRDMLDKTQSDLEFPEFSEIYLRVALKEVCGKNFVVSTDVLELYRKLLVLYYCEQYASITHVNSIMERCFGREDICNIINERNSVLGKWLEFKTQLH